MLRPVDQILISQRTPRKEPVQTGLKTRQGEVLQGTILRKYPGGEVLVSADGKQFLAHTSLDLLEGQKHRFQILSLKPRIELKVLGNPLLQSKSPIQLWSSGREARGKLGETLMQLAGQGHLKGLSRESSTALSRLSQLLPAVLFSKPGRETFQWISRHLPGLGLFWETKVARSLMGAKGLSPKQLLATDLKGTLLSLQKSLKAEKGGGSALDSLLIRTEEAIHLIEQDQILNLSSLEEDLGWFWFIPGVREEGFQQAEVFADSREEDQVLYINMFLECSCLGEMDIRVSLVDSHITVNMLLQDEESLNFIKDQLHLLNEGLMGAGMTVGQITCDLRAGQDSEIIPFLRGKGGEGSIHLVI